MSPDVGAISSCGGSVSLSGSLVVVGSAAVASSGSSSSPGDGSDALAAASPAGGSSAGCDAGSGGALAKNAAALSSRAMNDSVGFGGTTSTEIIGGGATVGVGAIGVSSNVRAAVGKLGLLAVLARNASALPAFPSPTPDALAASASPSTVDGGSVVRAVTGARTARMYTFATACSSSSPVILPSSTTNRRAIPCVNIRCAARLK